MQLDYVLEEGQEGMLQVFDLTGKLVNSYRLNTENNTLYINEHKLKNGVYLYKVVIDEETVMNEKLVIVK